MPGGNAAFYDFRWSQAAIDGILGEAIYAPYDITGLNPFTISSALANILKNLIYHKFKFEFIVMVIRMV